MYYPHTCFHILYLTCTIYTHQHVSRKSLNLPPYLSPLQIRDDPNDAQLVTNAAQRDAWILRDVTCRNYIFATLTKPMKESLYSCDTATAMWTRLDTQYRLRAAENLHLLWQAFYDFSHDPGITHILIFYLKSCH